MDLVQMVMVAGWRELRGECARARELAKRRNELGDRMRMAEEDSAECFALFRESREVVSEASQLGYIATQVYCWYRINNSFNRRQNNNF
ncbi:MAG TPA: hypothetical protein VJH37_02290 [Candidatus Nanoarchaeia archaeon]|nr:hypothetical protein [Candidatus Nanoarchaeia archaeon]